jgi:hypothetical protein
MLYLWDSIPSILVSFLVDSSIINTIYTKCIRDASSFLQSQELSLAQPPSFLSQSINTILPALLKVQTLPTRLGLLELMLPTEPNPPNSNVPKTDSILFNINELANKYESK